jgi:hypothetical protein
VGVLQNILGSTLVDSVKGLIDEFHTSPELKAQMQAAVDANKTQIDLAQLALESKTQDVLARETEAASANIRAEAQSGDKYTSRARPSFLYVMLGILACNYVAFPLLGKTPLAFPDALFWLFGSCMLGYTGARSWEKYASLGQGK